MGLFGSLSNLTFTEAVCVQRYNFTAIAESKEFFFFELYQVQDHLLQLNKLAEKHNSIIFYGENLNMLVV
jgi:hypothetical protein